MSNSQLFLIDANSLCYRSFYAIKGLATSQGQATNAVYGFLSTLRKLLRDYQPQYVGVCFDLKGKTLREAKFSDYKIQRKPMPDDLVSQLPLIRKVVKAYRLSIFEKEGYEADDLIATLALRAAAEGIEVIIVSDDKDMFQLVNDKIKVFQTREDKILSHEDLKTNLGFDPGFIIDYIALAGDQVDNIPGVKGIGEVSAKNLIEKYGRLEEILENVDTIEPARVRNALQQQRDMAVLSKELAILEKNVPVEISLEDMRVKEPDPEELLKLFRELEFKRLAIEMIDKVKPASETFSQRIQGKDECEKLIQAIRQKKSFAFVTAADMSFFVALDENQVYHLTSEEFQELRSVFEAEEIVKITADVKAFFKATASYPWKINGEVFDCLLADYLLAPARSSHDLVGVAWERLKIAISEGDYARKTTVLLQLYSVLKNDLEKHELCSLFKEIEIPLSSVLARMELEGVKIDEKLLQDLSRDCDKKIQDLMVKLFALADGEFNLNSPKQLSHVLFEKLKLPVVKKTKTGFSTDEEVLTLLAAQHALPALILEYRQLAKLKSTYIDALPKLMDPITGKIHAEFDQMGTETGRLSSSRPNLQNIPIRAELGRQIRKAFIPLEKDHVIMAADYSQIELRILAHLSQDKNLMEAFEQDQDIHNFTAAQVFDVDLKDVTPVMRNLAKRVNFGIVYGISGFGLAKDLGVPIPQAQEFIDRYFLRYPRVKEFLQETIVKCEEKGWVSTLLNRKRYIPEIHSPNMAIRQFAQRQAINAPVQGSAADLIKLAMIRIQEALDQFHLSSKMIITVHDELVFDVPQEEEKKMRELIHQHMEEVLKLTVPIKVTVKVGKNWLEAE
ncbi:MAG: DNA polymerase I [Candidatus Omnitrophica bacterium]|nr:DNA polymerase I [Candidatus Omnitrophota bacterium]